MSTNLDKVFEDVIFANGRQEQAQTRRQWWERRFSSRTCSSTKPLDLANAGRRVYQRIQKRSAEVGYLVARVTAMRQWSAMILVAEESLEDPIVYYGKHEENYKH